MSRRVASARAAKTLVGDRRWRSLIQPYGCMQRCQVPPARGGHEAVVFEHDVADRRTHDGRAAHGGRRRLDDAGRRYARRPRRHGIGDRRPLRPVPLGHDGGVRRGPRPYYPHVSPRNLYVRDRTIALFDGTGWREGRAGDFLYVPPRGIHAFRNDSGTLVSMLILFAPPHTARGLLPGAAAERLRVRPDLHGCRTRRVHGPSRPVRGPGRGMTVIDWLLDADPANRWQVMRDLTHERGDVVSAERSRVATEGWGARLLALQAPDGLWGGKAVVARLDGHLPRASSSCGGSGSIPRATRLGGPSASSASASRGATAPLAEPVGRQPLLRRASSSRASTATSSRRARTSAWT